MALKIRVQTTQQRLEAAISVLLIRIAAMTSGVILSWAGVNIGNEHEKPKQAEGRHAHLH
jgi:hypothetical protein